MTPHASGELKNRICLITGATSGIGYVTARELARKGATVVLVARSESRAKESVARIQQETGNQSVDYLLADLSSQEQVRRLADAFTARYPHLHILINNAGAVFWSRQETVDGLEMTLALNHLAPFLLTNLLLPTILESTPARIITVSSTAHRGATIPFDDLQQRNHAYRAFRAYGESKLANILFTYELARRQAGKQITANTLHPGFVASNFGKGNGLMSVIFTLISPFAISPEHGAQTSIYLASSPDVDTISGQYFIKEKPARSSNASYSVAAAERLWTVSEQLTGIASRTAPAMEKASGD